MEKRKAGLSYSADAILAPWVVRVVTTSNSSATNFIDNHVMYSNLYRDRLRLYCFSSIILSYLYYLIQQLEASHVVASLIPWHCLVKKWSFGIFLEPWYHLMLWQMKSDSPSRKAISRCCSSYLPFDLAHVSPAPSFFGRQIFRLFQNCIIPTFFFAVMSTVTNKARVCRALYSATVLCLPLDNYEASTSVQCRRSA